MKTEHRYKQFAPLFVLIAVFYLIFFRLPYDTVVVEGQLRLWARIANGLISPYVLASLALGVIGVMFCLRAKKEKRPVKGLMFASICYSSGALLFFGMMVWWMVSGTVGSIFSSGLNGQ